MDYQIKFKILKKGFSLAELVIVIAIFALILGISTATYSNLKAHNNLEIATGGLVEAIRLAESSAQSGKGDSKWGVKIISNQIIIFKGDSYILRDTAFNETLGIPSDIIVSGISEIVFEKLTGSTLTVGTTTLSNSTETKNIYINEKGTITY